MASLQVKTLPCYSHKHLSFVISSIVWESLFRWGFLGQLFPGRERSSFFLERVKQSQISSLLYYLKNLWSVPDKLSVLLWIPHSVSRVMTLPTLSPEVSYKCWCQYPKVYNSEGNWCLLLLEKEEFLIQQSEPFSLFFHLRDFLFISVRIVKSCCLGEVSCTLHFSFPAVFAKRFRLLFQW